MDERLRVAIIIGSTRDGRFGPTVAEWFAAKARRREDLEVDVVDLAEAGLPDTLSGEEGTPAPAPVRVLAPRLAAADAFAVVTPEYNRSFPAPLKTAIDWYYEEWQAKPVTFVSYGRESGGRYATDHLRQVFTELHAVAIRETVSLPCYWDLFAADGSWPKATATCNATARITLDRLTWWAHALREARIRRPYKA
ncbi:NADPH-dependent FMN reductase [Streptosporangium lutulentum]|uniref:NAD(P)H-dependent FMN reductase n=1 Tax=Streptosporangium lutulentum TaxID=1461250 RepID=A0ABT9Q6K4_9ACTN|nr:NAD(P)H-dependent oxidoreductase [Streptosporangium lutulentum]MDP9842366.1 NAD(P)H-dependent FMN reductase [Streptosporangium lutulentum]